MPCPNSDCTHPVQGSCCPICDGCLFEESMYNNGQSFRPDNCRECNCFVSSRCHHKNVRYHVCSIKIFQKVLYLLFVQTLKMYHLFNRNIGTIGTLTISCQKEKQILEIFHKILVRSLVACTIKHCQHYFMTGPTINPLWHRFSLKPDASLHLFSLLQVK